MALLKASIILLVLVWLTLKTFNIWQANRRFQRAKVLEGKGDYHSACFEYALAFAEGCLAKTECVERIRVLWDKHGPFSYEDKKSHLEKNLEEMAPENKRDPYGCDRAGATVALAECLDAIEVIEQVVDGKKNIAVPRRRVFPLKSSESERGGTS